MCSALSNTDSPRSRIDVTKDIRTLVFDGLVLSDKVTFLEVFCIYLDISCTYYCVVYWNNIHIIYIYLYYITCSPKVLFEDDIALGGIC